MRLATLTVRAFRNLAEAALEVPPAGVALLGANGQGKTNLLEAVVYPVLMRSFRGSPDREVSRQGGPGFHVAAAVAGADAPHELAMTFDAGSRKKRVTLDGVEERRLQDVLGRWLAVVFLPGDVALAGGSASERRRLLDRMLSLADPGYFTALLRYRAALEQRNAALRRGQGAVARACEPALAEAGAALVAARLAWAEAAGTGFGTELAGLGEPRAGTLRYRGDTALADAAAWPERLEQARDTDRQRGVTSVGPHRDDLALGLDGRSLRTFGSTGQLRSAAIALKLLELETLRAARGTAPALVLDDVFAELDGPRQERLAARLRAGGAPQLFVSAPRRDELPAGLGLPVWEVTAGAVRPREGTTA